MKYQYKVSRQFEKEYLAIVDYLIDTFGKKTALEFDAKVRHQISLILDNPEIASPEPLLAERKTLVRSKIVSPHTKAIYYVKGNIIFFSDLWDMRREPSSLSRRIRLK